MIDFYVFRIYRIDKEDFRQSTHTSNKQTISHAAAQVSIQTSLRGLNAMSSVTRMMSVQEDEDHDEIPASL
jgi:hypothetical protein